MSDQQSDSPPPSPSNNYNSHRPFPSFPAFPPPFAFPSAFPPSPSFDFATTVQHQHLASPSDLLRLHQQQHQLSLSRFGYALPPPPPPPSLPFLTMPPPAPAIGLGQSQYQSMSSSSISGDNGRYSSARFGSDSAMRSVEQQMQISEPAGISYSQRHVVTAPPAITSPPPAAPPRTTRNTHSVPHRASSGSSNTLGQTPADPHGVRSARAGPRSQRPSVLGGPRLGSFLREHREGHVRSNSTGTRGYMGADPMHTTPHARTATRRIPAGIFPPRTAAVATVIPTIPLSGPLLTILAHSLRDCPSYDAVAQFAKSNYPHLSDTCFSHPRFLQEASRPAIGAPSPLTMDALLQRLVAYHLSPAELRGLRPPDWEGYMLLALELKWLETGMVVCGFGGDLVEQVWTRGQDRGGSGEGGRYVEWDVRRRLEGLVWEGVKGRFCGGGRGR